MSTPVNCPNCGSTLAPGATSCARCGHQLAEPAAPEVTSGTPGPQSARPPAAAPMGPTASLDVAAEIGKLRERWAVTQSPYLLALGVLALVAFLFGTVGHFVFLSADSFTSQTDGIAWYNAATGAAIAAVAVAVLVRWQNPSPAGGHRDDLRIAGVLAGMAGLWMLLAIYFGFNDRLDPEEGWFRYAFIFALLAAAWCAIARPFDKIIGTLDTVTVGMIAGGVAALLYLIGWFMGMSDDLSTYSKGVTFQDIGEVLVVLLLALFLGLRPKLASRA